jgi:Flp pilus assembly protein TadD
MKYWTLSLPIARCALVFFVIPVSFVGNSMAVGGEDCDALLKRGEELLGEHQPEAARIPILQVTKACPTNPRGYDLLGISYDSQDRFEEAQQAFRKAIALAPRGAGFHNNLAISFAHSGKTGEAITEFQNAVRLDVHNEFANGNLADYYVKEKNYRRALYYLRNARADQSTDPSLVYELAQAYFGAGETKPALQTVARLWKLAPSDARIRFALGLLLAQHDQYAGAVEQFEAVAVQERDFAVYQNLGLAYSKLGRLPEAQRAFEQALRLDPSNPEPYFGIGINLLAARSIDQAIYPLSQAYDKAPQRVDIACTLAEALIQGQDFSRAHDLLAEIRAKSPNNPIVVQTEGDLYRAQGQDSKALESYRQILRYDPENVPARLRLAKVYLVLGQTVEAKNEFKRVLKANPTNGDAHAGLGRIALRAGQEDLALQELSRALREDPDELDANEDLAAIKSRRGQLAVAQTVLEKLVRLDPNNARYHYQLGRVLLKLGRVGEAQREFARSQQIGVAKPKDTTEP